MAEEQSKRARGTSFLKKSKWGKILKEREPDSTGSNAGANGRQNTFTLNDDVVDFLKPSTEKSMPKLDIAIAKRWPDAHEVRRAEDASPNPSLPIFTKPKRRKGLTVGFVKTLPEIIGEGGDEAPDPPREISRNKAMVQRSISDRKPGSQDFGRPGPRSPPIPQNRAMPMPAPLEDDDFVPKPLKRAQTSHDEISAPLQKKYGSPPSAEAEPHKPSLGRTPTGLSSYRSDHFGHTSPTDTPIDQQQPAMGAHGQENSLPRARGVPTINTHIDSRQLEQGSAASSNYSQGISGGPAKKSYQGLSPATAMSPVQQKRREMSASEGMAFRRASMLIQQDGEDDDESPPQTGHGQSSFQDQQSRFAPASEAQSERFSRPASKGRSGAAVTPDAPNPFADPKYINKQYSRVEESNIAPNVQEQPQSLRQTARHRAPARGDRVSENTILDQRHAPAQQTRPSPMGSLIQSSDDRRGAPTVPPSASHRGVASGEDNFARNVQPPATDSIPSRPALNSNDKGNSHSIIIPMGSTHDRPRSPATQEHMYHAGQDRSHQMYASADGSATNMARFPQSASHSRSSSQDGGPPQMLQPAGSGYQQSLSSQSPHYPSQLYHQESKEQSSKTSLLSPSRTGPSPTVPSPQNRGIPNDYFSTSRPAPGQPAKSPLNQLRRDESERPASSASNRSMGISASPTSPDHGNPAADAAYDDFAARIAHMKGVFRLTAEKEQRADRCTSAMWLRAGLWWYLRGKAGLEALLQRRNPSEPPREMLQQAHVDLAKSWWILSETLDQSDALSDTSPQGAHVSGAPDHNLGEGTSALRAHLKSLSLAMARNRLLPPTQSLIQGQDTRIWLEYPRFTSDAAAVLGGNATTSYLVADRHSSVDPYAMLPLGDTRTSFCYGRFPVEVYLNTDQADTDRVVLPCMLTVLRGRRDYQTSIAIASQDELVNLSVLPKQEDKRGLTWTDVSWKASSFGITLRLPRGFDLSVRMQERDFRAVWNLSEYARKVEKSLRAESDEKLVHEARLAELQYADSSSVGAFPSDKIRGCSALVFERTVPFSDGSGTRKMHRGYRILLITDPSHKTLSSVSHDVCRGTPLLFEYLTDSAANGTTAMVLRIREQDRQCRILLVFPDNATRQLLYDVLNGVAMGPDETVVGKMTLTALNIEPASQAQALAQLAHPALQTMQWQRLGVTNTFSDDPNSRIPDTVESESLRIVARHATGCITDRVNMGKGELRIRIPAVDKPLIQILRQPQEDLSMSIDTRNTPQQVADGMAQLMHTVVQQPTIRTFTFASMDDLHGFQAAMTGHVVRYDGIASTFGISRRRMVVPIYKKWEACNVRLQLIVKESVVQLLAFMDDFSHADALCFQVKSTDVFETIKGDGKHKKWAVKMVDAKFTLPSKEKGDQSEDEKLQRRFVNLEGLDYAEEHDDITVMFETERERDAFAQALPAATSVARGLTLKRRI